MHPLRAAEYKALQTSETLDFTGLSFSPTPYPFLHSSSPIPVSMRLQKCIRQKSRCIHLKNPAGNKKSAGSRIFQTDVKINENECNRQNRLNSASGKSLIHFPSPCFLPRIQNKAAVNALFSFSEYASSPSSCLI